MRFSWDHTNFIECAQDNAVLFADVRQDVGREVEAGVGVGNPDRGEVIGSRQRIGSWRESHANRGFVAGTDLNDAGRFQNIVNFSGVGGVKVDCKLGGGVAVVADDHARGDGVTDGHVHRLTGRRQ